MEIRKITPEERITASKIQSVAFLVNSDFSSSQSDPDKFKKGYETGRAVFDDSGKMCSCFELIPYEIRFNKKTVKMAGIGGVASLPEERKNGYIRSLFRYCFDEMRENNQIFSYLYPFSHTYYRKYGYELSITRSKYSIPITSLGHFHETGNMSLYRPESDNPVINELYSQFIHDKNLAMVRSEKLWNTLLNKDPYSTHQFTYIWYNDEGRARGYIIFEARSKENFSADMIVKELIWLDEEALFSILKFVNRYTPKYDKFIWDAPDFLNMHLLLPEPYNVGRQINTGGMNRIVDVQKVLELLPYPESKGQLVFHVVDDFLPWNDGCFVVQWDSDGVSVVQRESPPDISCSIQSLAQLVVGFSCIEESSFRQDIKVYNKHALLSQVLSRKPLYLNDYF